MRISVQIPKDLLRRIDRRAKLLGTSRSKLLVLMLKKELDGSNDWPPGFFERFTPLDEKTADLFDKSMLVVKNSRRSKKAKYF